MSATTVQPMAPAWDSIWEKVTQVIALNGLIREASEGKSESVYQACGVIDSLLRDVDAQFEQLRNLAGVR